MHYRLLIRNGIREAPAGERFSFCDLEADRTLLYTDKSPRGYKTMPPLTELTDAESNWYLSCSHQMEYETFIENEEELKCSLHDILDGFEERLKKALSEKEDADN